MLNEQSTEKDPRHTELSSGASRQKRATCNQGDQLHFWRSTGFRGKMGAMGASKILTAEENQLDLQTDVD